METKSVMTRALEALPGGREPTWIYEWIEGCLGGFVLTVQPAPNLSMIFCFDERFRGFYNVACSFPVN